MLQSRNRWVAISSLLITGVCYAAAGGSIIRLINNLFMVGMILLMVAGLYTVISGGFFTLFSKGFRSLFLSKSEREYGGYDEPLNDDGAQPQSRSQQVKQVAAIAFITGLILTVLSFLLILI
ncbi:DUF3899 domain-containing protein [Desmospora activa]|uniref:Uncharacterized protein DUF3899 n=1 Tax=Desmospora activa DSM 45169 TaxID=1121389 RepID=A0A2T4Z794_9BACL|nr:DUF3899 domain-containing protein [Desmospora activa]PTM57715.1 uncharacterized protein DUF3899 [Desmospora activa DSM 45169]